MKIIRGYKISRTWTGDMVSAGGRTADQLVIGRYGDNWIDFGAYTVFGLTTRFSSVKNFFVWPTDPPPDTLLMWASATKPITHTIDRRYIAIVNTRKLKKLRVLTQAGWNLIIEPTSVTREELDLWQCNSVLQGLNT